MTSPAPLLWLEQARVDRAGVPLCDGLDARTDADRVGLVGDWSALFALAGAQARLVRGRAELDGVPVRQAVASGQVGLALQDAPFPPGMRVLDLLTASGRLLGLETRAAKRQAEQALGELGLGGVGQQSFDRLALLSRRGVGLAHALIGGPAMIALEQPLSGLDEPAREVALGWIARVATGRRLLVGLGGAAMLGRERGVLDSFEQVLVLGAGRVLAQGAPDQVLQPAARYSLVVRKTESDLVARLRAAGLEAGPAPGVPANADGALHLVVETAHPEALDALTDLLVELGVPLLELVPIAWSAEERV